MTDQQPRLFLSEAQMRAIKAKVSDEDGKRLDVWAETGVLVIV